MNVAKIEVELLFPPIAYSNQALVEPLQAILVRFLTNRLDRLSSDSMLPSDLLIDLFRKAEVIRAMPIANWSLYLAELEHARLFVTDSSLASSGLHDAPSSPRLTYVLVELLSYSP